MKILLLIICTITSPLLFASNAFAELVVIVHPNNALNELTADDLSKLFLGKRKEYQPGLLAMPIDLSKGNELREEFYQKIIKKTPNQLNSYWSRIVFTGKGEPPKNYGSVDDILDLVAEDPSAIGYIDAESVDETVKVVFRLQ